jgi:hypothetical protein
MNPQPSSKLPPIPNKAPSGPKTAKTPLVIGACVALLLILGCAIFWNATGRFGRIRSSGPIRIVVAFSGFTNDATGSRLAAFRVSNVGGVGLFRWPFYTIEESGRPSPSSSGASGRGDVLAPGESRICLLPAPTNNVPWRAVLNFSTNDWRRKFGGFSPQVRRVLQSKSLSFPVTECMSDWVGAVSDTPASPSSRARVASFIILPPSSPLRKTNGPPITNGPSITPPAQRQ